MVNESERTPSRDDERAHNYHVIVVAVRYNNMISCDYVGKQILDSGGRNVGCKRSFKKKIVQLSFAYIVWTPDEHVTSL